MGRAQFARDVQGTVVVVHCAILLRVPFYILHDLKTVHQFSLRDSEACIPRHPTAPTHTYNPFRNVTLC